jgi:protein-S-isoprenylcysteine O-methyltransferase Ste14
MDTNNKMSIFGVGPKISRVALPYLMLTIIISVLCKPIFNFPFLKYKVLLFTGIIFIVVGLFVNFSSAIRMIKAVRQGVLLKTGFFAICRNPMYVSFIYLTIPGLALVMNSVLVLTTSVIICIALLKIIPAEEKLLQEKFGDEYKRYKKSVSGIIPFLKN